MRSKPRKRTAERLSYRENWKNCSTAKTKVRMPPPFLQPSYALRSRCEAAVVARARWRGALRYLRLRTQNDFPVRVPARREVMRLLHFCERQHRRHAHFQFLALEQTIDLRELVRLRHYGHHRDCQAELL